MRITENTREKHINQNWQKPACSKFSIKKKKKGKGTCGSKQRGYSVRYIRDSQKPRGKRRFIDLTIRTGKHTGKEILCQVDCGSARNLIIYRDYCKVKADGKLVYSTAELTRILQQS